MTRTVEDIMAFRRRLRRRAQIGRTMVRFNLRVTAHTSSLKRVEREVRAASARLRELNAQMNRRP
jgi:hypothetical protein